MIFVDQPGTTTIVIPVEKGKEDKLKTHLEEQGKRSAALYKALEAIGTIHFARFVFLPKDGDFNALLAFESNHDGSESKHKGELITQLAGELDAVLAHCKGYPGADPAAKKRFLEQHSLAAITPYRGHPNLPVAQIKQDRRLRKEIAAFVEQEARRGTLPSKPSEIHAAIKAHLERNHKRLMPGPPRSLPSWFSFAVVLAGLAIGISGFSAMIVVGAYELRGSEVAFAWLGTLIGLLLFVLIAYLGFGEWVRGIEASERYESDNKRGKVIREPDRDMLAIAMNEDRQTQNALTHVALVKPSADRAAVLWVILTAVRLLAAMLYTRGKLGSIDSIHCARWVPIDGYKRLLFLSNYDGSWESYLGEFVDKLPFWLTAVWSNTDEFPTTTDRFESNGARDEEWFKRWTRTRQHHTQVWYAAYPNMSVKNVNDNAALREGLRRRLADKELREWLRLI